VQSGSGSSNLLFGSVIFVADTTRVDLYIDDREEKRIEMYVKYISHFIEEMDLPIELHMYKEHLEVGDIVFLDCGIEVKDGSDAVASIFDGRIRSQARSLAQYSYPFIYVVAQLDMFDQAYKKAILTSLSNVYVEHYVFSTIVPSVYLMCYNIVKVMEKLVKLEEGPKDTVFFYPVPRTIKEENLRMVASMDTIENAMYEFPLQNQIVVRELDDFTMVKVIEENSRLTYNMGPIRLGGPIRAELSPGIIMKVNGIIGENFRIGLNEIEQGIIHQQNVEVLPVEAFHPTYFITSIYYLC